MDAPLPRLGPRFRIESRLEQSALFDVFLAHQEGAAGFSRPVLLKVLRPDRVHDDGVTKLFAEQARIAAQFTHPNIVHLYDFGEHDGTFFLVTEFLEGHPLASLLSVAAKANRPLTAGFVASVGSHVCAALAYAYARPGPTGAASALVHRDLNPRSLAACADGTAKVLDFALARPAGFGGYTESFKGTPAYFAPEQFGPDDIDPRSDLFSLGAVLWELVARRPVVGVDEPEKVARWIREIPAPRLRTVDPACPEELAAIVERALQIDPARRFQSAAEMGRALDAFLSQIGANPSEEIRSELARAQIVAGSTSIDGAQPRTAEAAPGLPEWFTAKPDVFSSALPDEQGAGLQVGDAAGAAPVALECALPLATTVAAPLPARSVVPGTPLPRAKVHQPLLTPVRWALAVGLLALFAAGALLFGHLRKPSPPPPTAAMIMITSDPSEATVRIDGTVVGTTPYTVKNVLPPGDHTVLVDKEGFATRSLAIKGGEQAWHWVNLEPLHVHTRPPTPAGGP